MVSLKAEALQLNSQLSNLAAAKSQIEQYGYFKEVAKTVIPADKNQAQIVLQIVQIADSSGISLSNITFPSSTLGGGTGSALNTDAISQAKPVPGIAGLYSIELTITPQTGKDLPQARQVTYPKLIDFLRRIENNRHTAQITEVNIQPETGSPYINFTLKTNVFIKP
ncbi:MAG: hypothetical protein WD877_00175 [Candidatus Saccharimonadales bacterium]